MPQLSNLGPYSSQMGGQMGTQMGSPMGGQMGGMGGQMGAGMGNQMPPQMGSPMGQQGPMGGQMRQMGGPMGNHPVGISSLEGPGGYPGQLGGHMGPSGPPGGCLGPGGAGSQFGQKGGGCDGGRGKGGGGRGRGKGGGSKGGGDRDDRQNFGAPHDMGQFAAQFSSLDLGPMVGDVGMQGGKGQYGSHQGGGPNGPLSNLAPFQQQKGGGKNQMAQYGGSGASKGGGQQLGMPHSNLFIGNLPENATEALLREAFQPFGNVVSCRVFTRNGRTCALVKMGSVGEAEQACKSVSRAVGGDQKSRWLVKYADADLGSAGHGDKGGGRDGGAGQLSSWSSGKGGGHNAGAAQLAAWSGNKGQPSKGGNFGSDVQALGYGGGKGSGGAPGGFGWGGPGKGGGSGQGRRKERDPIETAPSDNLYVKGLPPRITETQLHRTFSKAGKVVELKILRYGDSLECAALVRMANVEAAKASIDMLNGKAPEGAVPPLTIRYHGKDPSAVSDNLYVKGLPLNFTQDMLHLLFGQCGTMRRSRILMPPSRELPEDATLDSAALVQMSSVEEATRAIQMLNGTVPEGVGPQMVIRFAEAKTGATATSGASNEQTPTDNLYVKGLPLSTPDFLLRAVFAQFGNVVRLKILEPRGGEALDCAALVQMASVDESKAAVQALHGRVLAAPLPPMRVRFAGKDQQPGSNLYVAGLPITIHEQQLRATFARCGTVVRVRLLVQTGRPETHALVQMASFEEAENAIRTLHGTPPENLGPTLVVRYATNRARERGPNVVDANASGPAAELVNGTAPDGAELAAELAGDFDDIDQEQLDLEEQDELSPLPADVQRELMAGAAEHLGALAEDATKHPVSPLPPSTVPFGAAPPEEA